MEKYNTVMDDISFNNGDAVFKFFQEDTTFINLKKDGDSYIITGFNGIDSKDITNQVMRNNYLALIRAVKLTRSEQYRNKVIK